jgi:hypothetical protein
MSMDTNFHHPHLKVLGKKLTLLHPININLSYLTSMCIVATKESNYHQLRLVPSIGHENVWFFVLMSYDNISHTSEP